MPSFKKKESNMIRILMVALFVLSLTACEKGNDNVPVPTEETINEGE